LLKDDEEEEAYGLAYHGGGGGRFIQSKAKSEVDAGCDRATLAWVRHDADEPLTSISPCYCTRAARPANLEEEAKQSTRRTVCI